MKFSVNFGGETEPLGGETHPAGLYADKPLHQLTTPLPIVDSCSYMYHYSFNRSG